MTLRTATLIALIGGISLSATAQTGIGAEQADELLRLTAGKRVAVVANRASVVRVGSERPNIVDHLLAIGVNLRKIFAPEHGFRDPNEAGATVRDGFDPLTGLPFLSLYGKRKKPTTDDLADIDAVIFDLQDVGTRFYTYISTMHCVMEACAEQGKTLIVADRPNPNDTVDGPIRRSGFESFVGMHPIPLLHGLTVGELAMMINGEGWLAGGLACPLEVVRTTGWRHGDPWEPLVPPSPNLPNGCAVRLYPSLCLFEGTAVSIGRGTPFPFQVAGYPSKAYGDFTFRPQPMSGFDSNPLHNGKDCYGVDLRNTTPSVGFSLQWLIAFHRTAAAQGDTFFTRPNHFDLLAGSDELRLQLEQGCTEEQIRTTWDENLADYRAMRKKYLLYPETTLENH
jgi:uncharacterized protein YbbC (DUF1343 family)